jgi:molecular chaperone DnaK
VSTKTIEKNTTIPTKRTQVFTTAADFQTAVTIHVLQGERPMAADNVSLGVFNLEGIPPAPRGVPQIEVTFDIDANGILNVTAKDRGTGKEAKIRITASTKLSKEDKERLIKEAEQFSDQDKKKIEEAELRNNADNMIYTADRTKKDIADKLTPDQTTKIDTAISALKDALAKGEFAEIKSKTDALGKVLQEVGTVIYQQAAAAAQAQQQAQNAQAGQQPQGGQSGSETAEQPSGEKVVDSEDYKVK